MPFRPAWTTFRSSRWRAASISWRVQAMAALDPLGMGPLLLNDIVRELPPPTSTLPPALGLLARTPTRTCSAGEVASMARKAKRCHDMRHRGNDLWR